jgi:hypothetical protein
MFRQLFATVVDLNNGDRGGVAMGKLTFKHLSLDSITVEKRFLAKKRCLLHPLMPCS